MVQCLADDVKVLQFYIIEGVVGKDRRSVYEPGRRSRSWLKTKVPGAHLAHEWNGDA
jgi:hypothetical protein